MCNSTVLQVADEVGIRVWVSCILVELFELNIDFQELTKFFISEENLWPELSDFQFICRKL